MNTQSKILILLCFLFSINLDAQSYSGADAEKILSSASSVLMGSQSAVPTFVVLKEEEQIPARDFEQWERKTFPFSDGISFVTERTVDDKDELSHQFRYQYYRGIPVEHALSVIHSKDGMVTYFNGDIHNNLSIDVSPSINETDATKAALAHFNIEHSEWTSLLREASQQSVPEGLRPSEYIEQSLVIYPYEGEYYLAWKILLSSQQFQTNEYIYVDAHRNKIIHTYKASMGCNGGDAVTTWRGTQDIDTDLVGNFRLHNDCGARDIRTRNFATNADFTNGNNFWNSTNNRFRGAHSAHFGVTGAWDYFSAVHGQIGLNADANDGTVNVFIGTALGDNNAFYIPNTQNLEFGIGLNLTNPFDDYTTPDICGHEFAHGVFYLTGGVTNLGNHQSLALHEGIADIFGNEVEADIDNAAPEWSIGEERNDGTVRFLNTPNVDVHPPGIAAGSPDTYFGDFWTNNSSHIDGGVIRFWYFLLSEGGSGTNDNGTWYNVQGIGRANAAAVLYNAISTGGFGASPSYFTARAATLQAATNIFGVCSNQRRQVGNAWRAVGVGDSSLPDFSLSNLTLPGGNSVPTQTSFTVNYSLTTNISSSAQTSTYVGFFLRPLCTNSGLSSPFEVEIGNTCFAGTNAISNTITLPSNTTPGTYTLIAKADGLNWVAESSEWNNTTCRVITVTANNNLPDFISRFPSVSPSSVQSGSSFSTTVQLKNQGNANGGSSYMSYYLSTNSTYSSNDIYLGNKYFGALNQGSSSSGTRSLTIPSSVAPGNYYIVYRADCYNWRAELNENNNNTFKFITVTAPASNLPDLVITNVSPSPSTSSPPSVTRGQFFTVNYNLTNLQSGTNAGSTTTRIYLSTNNTVGSGDFLVRTDFNQTPGSRSGTFQIPWSAQNQYYYILIVADFNNSVTEAFETNNVGNGHLIVVSGFTSTNGENDLTEESGELINPRLSSASESFELSVFPNPTSDQFTLAYPVQPTEMISISLYNSAGQHLGIYNLDATQQTGQWQYPGEQLPSGLYYIQWHSGKDRKSIKVVVE